jgi:hypothetical protein
LTGNEDNLFEPNKAVTRGEFMAILAGLSGKNVNSVEEAAEWAMASGISDGSNPYNSITRQQMSRMLWSFSDSKSVTNENELDVYEDKNKISDYAKQSMNWLVNNKIMSGTSSTTLDPTGLATKAQVSTILKRYLDEIGN